MEFRPMSPEDIERTVQFLLQQQAQFAADVARLSTKTDLIADGLIGLTGIVGRLTEAQARTDEQLKRTDKQLERTDEQLKETDTRLSAHIERVDAHLNVVIDMFERHLRENHGHNPS